MKNKILIIFTILIICFFSICITNIYATDATNKTIIINGTTYTLPSNCPDNFFIVNVEPYNETRLYFPADNTYSDFIAVFQKDSDTVLVMYDNKEMTNRINLKWYSISLNSSDFSHATLNDGTWSSLGTAFNADTSFIYSTNNIYKSTLNYKPENIDTPFFQAPLQENLTLEGTIMEMAQTQIIPTVLKMIATAIGLLISLIGLRKGFKMLVNGSKT